ncbi:MAG: hypothetical protein AB7O62_00075 [Pirellulales bacterium]
MSTFFYVLLALAGDPADLSATAPPDSTTVVASDEAPPDDVTKIGISKQRTAGELREAVHATLKRTAAKIKSDPHAAADELLPLFVEIKLDKELIKEDRDKYANVVRLRLLKIRDQVQADAKKSQQKSARDKSNGITASSAEQPGNAAGGLAQQDLGQELVELIERTIKPESWESNGGNGVIIYFASLHVLVIRQTDEVHEAIGGVVHGLRRAQ